MTVHNMNMPKLTPSCQYLQAKITVAFHSLLRKYGKVYTDRTGLGCSDYGDLQVGTIRVVTGARALQRQQASGRARRMQAMPADNRAPALRPTG